MNAPLPYGFADPRPLTAREAIELEIERLIALLDALDGDADFEAEGGLDQDDNLVSLNPAYQRPAKHVRRVA